VKGPPVSVTRYPGSSAEHDKPLVPAAYVTPVACNCAAVGRRPPPVHMAAPSPVAKTTDELSQQIAIPALSEDNVAVAAADLALLRAEPKLVNTIPDKIPIIAITTSNSIRVKPFFRKLFFMKN
jgi:hypothetical protein